MDVCRAHGGRRTVVCVRPVRDDGASALWQMMVYVGLMVLLVFMTVALWKVVNVFPLLGLPMLYYMAQDEWNSYKRSKTRKVKSENS